VITSQKTVLAKLRKICLSLPDTEETRLWEHPHFRVRGKIFVSFGEYKGEWGISLKVGELMQGVFLGDPRFFRAPYVGKYGWVMLRVDAVPLNWTEIRGLVKGSYQLVAATAPRKRRVKKLQTKSRRNSRKNTIGQDLPGSNANS
jgi:predicted DNA-binding protein (MmcQ/YjbR family)